MSLTLSDYEKAADELGVPLATVRAFAEVESNGGGFIDGKRPKVQYEPHIMYKRLKANKGDVFANTAKTSYPDLVSVKMGSYQSLNAEDRDMDRAAKLIDRVSALESASWGMFQVMGFNWKTCGYKDVQAFVNAQYTSAGQLDTFVRFIRADARLLAALKAKDWATAARIYNGPLYAKNAYDTKLASAYKRYGGQ